MNNKCVRWANVTVYEFDVEVGGSAIPRHGGPSVGLAKTPKRVWSSPVALFNQEGEGNDRATGPSSGGADMGATARVTEDVAERLRRRLQRRRRGSRVRWFKPLERVTMLTKAGCSERRIYRMMMESAEIAMSRRLSIQVAKGG